MPDMTYFEKKKFGPLLRVKPNLTLLEQSPASACNLDLKYKKKICELPRHTANKIHPLIFAI
jgi:hypothetical protein